MASSLFQNKAQTGISAHINDLKQMIGGNPQGLFNQLYNSNPQFRDFANSMQGKTPDQAFRENGLDFSQYRNMY